MKSRWNGMCVAVLYVVLRMAVKWSSPPGYEDYKAGIVALAISLCILSILTLCFFKAFRPVSVFLVVSFQAVLDISRYAAVGLMICMLLRIIVVMVEDGMAKMLYDRGVCLTLK